MALDDPLPTLTYSRRPREDVAALVKAHGALVRKIAWHVHGRVGGAVDIADLVQIGMLALVEAANAYEDRGHAFATYAGMRIKGAMIDHLRRSATISRGAIARKRELDAARERLEQHHARPATAEEVAAELGLDMTGYHALVAECRPVHHESIEDAYSDTSEWFADNGESADEAIDRQRRVEMLAGAVAELPEREALVLQLYFAEELNLQEIGETLGIGAARVCQIKKAALDRLKGRLAGMM